MSLAPLIVADAEGTGETVGQALETPITGIALDRQVRERVQPDAIEGTGHSA
jgi:hypothetical protein